MSETQGVRANPEPTATQTSPPAKAFGPPKKKIVAVKVEGERWGVKFDGPVSRRDISHLTRLIRLEFIRSKRKGQLDRRKALRAKEIKE